MQIPKAMVVERIRSERGADEARRADEQLPEKIDTDRDTELLRGFGLDPSQLVEGMGGQTPTVS